MRVRTILRGTGGVTTREDLSTGGASDRLYATLENPYIVVDVASSTVKAYYQLSDDASVNLTSRAAASGIVPMSGTSVIDAEGFAYASFWAASDVTDHLEVHRAQ